ncbi:MAG: M20/M25/M40 family metallo-hydrolase [Methanomassiliicoccales archaeon]|nr:M20/M25/M40 family metallo-hydrolase [Methanomassiliicoccales archaeon]
MNRADMIVDLLKKLVSIDSVNPCLSPRHRGESEIVDFIIEHLRSIGVNARTQEVVDGRKNVIGVIRGSEKGRKLLIVAHLDTVGVDSMVIPPFNPVITGNRLYGRGSADTKGGMAAALEALRSISLDRNFKGEVIFAGTVDEENEAKGIEKLVGEVEADAAIVIEPVGLNVVVAHKGFAWQEFKVMGKAAHGSDFANGIDAIFRTQRLLAELIRMNDELMEHPHPLLGPASLHASQIYGGEGWSTYPAQCVLTVERRTLPGETKQKVEREFQAIADHLLEEGIHIETKMHFFRVATEISPDEAIVQSLLKATSDVGIDCQVTGMSAWPEAGVLNLSGIPSVVFGPGGCKGHESDEYVELDSVLKCCEVLEKAIRIFLS